MARSFNVPSFYRSALISGIKQSRQESDPKKKDLTPSVLDFGPVKFKIARHFGFCFGVENAIEIAYRALSENPEKRIFLLSEMIHNQGVNSDLLSKGVRFLMKTNGEELFPFEELKKEDIVIVPAFGTTVEIQAKLQSLGIDPYYYDTTCPFVEKVWRRSAELGKKGFSVIVHGKRQHEETRATFSHSKETSPTLVILDKTEAQMICDFIKGNLSSEVLYQKLGLGMSKDFNPEVHLKRLGVVNQTTMLASETAEIAEMIRSTIKVVYGEENLKEHFADTRDTLCYATQENQSATLQLMDSGADIAIVVGGYNSSNTSHLVELLEKRMPTYYIRNADEIISEFEIRHFSLDKKETKISNNWLPKSKCLQIALTSGASCPDKTVDEVMMKIVDLFPDALDVESAISHLN